MTYLTSVKLCLSVFFPATSNAGSVSNRSKFRISGSIMTDAFFLKSNANKT